MDLMQPRLEQGLQRTWRGGQLGRGVGGVSARGQTVAVRTEDVLKTGRLGPGELLGLAGLVWPDEGQPGVGMARAARGAQRGPRTGGGGRSLGESAWGGESGSGIELGGLEAGGQRREPSGSSLAQGRVASTEHTPPGTQQPPPALPALDSVQRGSPEPGRVCQSVSRHSAKRSCSDNRDTAGCLPLSSASPRGRFRPRWGLPHAWAVRCGRLRPGRQPVQRVGAPDKVRLDRARAKMTRERELAGAG